MGCENTLALDICPTQEELQPKLLELLPRGRAWGEGGPGREQGGVIHQFWWAVAGVFAQLHAAICQLALEFFCQTQSLTTATWLEEYGLPDGCDPFPNLCAKVAAFGGVTCDFYATIAAALGWAIACGVGCGGEAGCMEAGMVGGPVLAPSTLIVVVTLADSPAFTGVQEIGPVAGYFEAGMSPSCGVDLTSLDCVLRRIVGAHLRLLYLTQ